jgi:hypothetical protein
LVQVNGRGLSCIDHLDGLQPAHSEGPGQRPEHGRQCAAGGLRRGGGTDHRGAGGGAHDEEQHRRDHDALCRQFLRVSGGRGIRDEQGYRGEYGERGGERDAPTAARDGCTKRG